MKNTVLFFLLSILISACSQFGDKSSRNPIIAENMLPGTTDWLIQVDYDTCQYPEHEFCRRPQIEGYCSQMSLTQGDTLSFYVSTNPPSQFIMDIYRMGYYQGLGGNLKKSVGPLEGEKQAEPQPDSVSNFFECNWNE